MSDDKNIWTVEARDWVTQQWAIWSSWVDRATAEAEKDHLEDEGYEARIVIAT
jgi:hypothetical protein